MHQSNAYNHASVSHLIDRHSDVDDTTPPTIWTPQRLPWNPGACGMGELWGYKYTPMTTYVCSYMMWSLIFVSTFVHLWYHLLWHSLWCVVSILSCRLGISTFGHLCMTCLKWQLWNSTTELIMMGRTPSMILLTRCMLVTTNLSGTGYQPK